MCKDYCWIYWICAGLYFPVKYFEIGALSLLLMVYNGIMNVQPPKLRMQEPKLRMQEPKLRTQGQQLRTQGQTLKIQGPKVRTQGKKQGNYMLMCLRLV